MLVIVGAVLAAGCSGATDPGDHEPVGMTNPESGEEALRTDDSVVLEEGDLAQAVVGDDEISFPEPTERVLNLRPATTIVSVVQGKHLLREIDQVSTNHGHRILRTHQGSLSGLARILHTRKHVNIPPAVVDLSGKTLVNSKGLRITCRTCRFEYDPSFDFAIDMEHGHVSNFLAQYDGNMASDWDIVVESFEPVRTTQELPVLRIPLVFAQPAGPVPIWETVVVSVNVGVSVAAGPGERMATGIHAHKRVYAGVAYENEHWQPFNDRDANLRADRPDLLLRSEGGAVSAYLRPAVDVRLYGIAGAYLDARAQLNLSTSVCPKPSLWSTSATFAIDVGASLAFVHKHPGLFNHEIFRRDFPLEQGVFSPVGVTCRGMAAPGLGVASWGNPPELWTSLQGEAASDALSGENLFP